MSLWERILNLLPKPVEDVEEAPPPIQGPALFRPESWPEDFEPDEYYDTPFEHMPTITPRSLDMIGAQYGLPPGTLQALAFSESSKGINRRSRSGAIGPWQLLPSTFQDMAKRMGREGLDIHDDRDNRDVAAYYLNYLGQQPYIGNEDIYRMLGAYHAGPRNFRLGRRLGSDNRTHAQNFDEGLRMYLDRVGLSQYKNPLERPEPPFALDVPHSTAGADRTRVAVPLAEVLSWLSTR